jgi:c-di-GMP-binding flagellar brake protein YcgR
MTLQSLVMCSDEKIVRVLRRVLSDLEIGVEHCADADTAIRKLTRQRFEAVIVDCSELKAATQVLNGVRNAPCNRRAIAVAIIDGRTGTRSAFELGAHFALYKPISTERAKASFRAARALMKRERRRNLRIPVEIPIRLNYKNGAAVQHAVTSDLSEGGMAVRLPKRSRNAGAMRVCFTLPGSNSVIECAGEVAWENAGGLTGIRFMDLRPEARQQLKSWMSNHSPDAETDDPPVRCKLTDLSLGGCYLEMASPFPVRTRVVLSMRVADLGVQAEGVVRVMHPEMGMGVEFTQRTAEQREHVEKFIHVLMNGTGTVPDLLVEPEGLDLDGGIPAPHLTGEEVEDPLLDLFHKKAELPAEIFLGELRRQRRSEPADETILSI